MGEMSAAIGIAGREPDFNVADTHHQSGRLLTIGELAQMTGVTPAAIRFYEQEGLLSPRRLGRLRVFSAADMRRLMSIVDYRRMGLPVSEIAAALHAADAPSSERQRLTTAMLKAHRHQLEARLGTLQSEIDHTAAALAAILATSAGNEPKPN